MLLLQIGSEMYFILKGRVNILVNGKQVTSFAEGAFFGGMHSVSHGNI
jgi:hypothetical protein